MLLRSTPVCSLLKMVCVVVILSLEGRTKQIPYITLDGRFLFNVKIQSFSFRLINRLVTLLNTDSLAIYVNYVIDNNYKIKPHCIKGHLPSPFLQEILDLPGLQRLFFFLSCYLYKINILTFFTQNEFSRFFTVRLLLNFKN